MMKWIFSLSICFCNLVSFDDYYKMNFGLFPGKISGSLCCKFIWICLSSKHLMTQRLPFFESIDKWYTLHIVGFCSWILCASCRHSLFAFFYPSFRSCGAYHLVKCHHTLKTEQRVFSTSILSQLVKMIFEKLYCNFLLFLSFNRGFSGERHLTLPATLTLLKKDPRWNLIKVLCLT